MKLFLSLVVFFTQTLHLTAQSFIKRDAVGGITIGFNHLNKQNAERSAQSEAFRKNFKDTLIFGAFKGQNPISVKYEFALSERWGLGVSVGWYTIKYSFSNRYAIGVAPNIKIKQDDYNVKFGSVSLGLRGNYHLLINDPKNDVYVGLSVGITKNNGSLVVTSTSSSGSTFAGYAEYAAPVTIYFAPTLAYRRYLTDNFGITAEAGYEKGAFLLAGVFMRFRPVKYPSNKN